MDLLNQLHLLELGLRAAKRHNEHQTVSWYEEKIKQIKQKIDDLKLFEIEAGF